MDSLPTETQFLGPTGSGSLIVFPGNSEHPALVSNGHWAFFGEYAKEMLEGTMKMWVVQIAKEISAGQIRLVDLNRTEFADYVKRVLRSSKSCVYPQGEHVYEATFSPEKKQVDEVYKTFNAMDKSGMLIRRPLRIASGAILYDNGEVESLSWRIIETIIWVWGPYIQLALLLGGTTFEYALNTSTVIVKDNTNCTIGAISLYHPAGVLDAASSY